MKKQYYPKVPNSLWFNYIIFVIFFMTTSCVTREACERRFPNYTSDSLSTIVNQTVIKYRDTTIYIKIPGDTVFQITQLKDGMSKLRTPLATSYAWVKDGKLVHKLAQKDTLIRRRLPGTVEKTTYSKTNVYKTQATSGYGASNFMKHLKYITAIMGGCVLILLFYKLFVRR